MPVVHQSLISVLAQPSRLRVTDTSRKALQCERLLGYFLPVTTDRLGSIDVFCEGQLWVG